ncbi:sugar transferase [Pseudooceanicola sp. MF1-13]|uniref:sugar transferase n=1 Tax=Pseudooceanicola sp. MF1-13 TaxID=3379095 RepID=UPI003891BAFB
MIYHVSPIVPATPLRVPDGKRLFDLILVLVTLPLWAPVLLVLMLVICAAQGPRVFYLHDRLGRHGRPFRMIKFRSMVPGAANGVDQILRDPQMAEEWATKAKLTHDPRCTPLGRWMRRYSVDEIPQILNVLLGDMSLVGPRPVPLAEFQRHYSGDAVQAYLALRPGISGLWQVTARNSDYDRRLRIDTTYAEQRGLVTDLRILWQTFGAVVRGTGC